MTPASPEVVAIEEPQPKSKPASGDKLRSKSRVSTVWRCLEAEISPPSNHPIEESKGKIFVNFGRAPLLRKIGLRLTLCFAFDCKTCKT